MTAPRPPAAGETFDYTVYLRRFGLTGLMSYPRLGSVSGFDRHYLVFRWLAGGRSRLEQTINRLLPEPEASFLAGLLVGSRRAIPPAVIDDLKRTGTTHVIAVSDASVVIVSGLLLW